MKTYRVNFSEDKKLILKQMKPKIKKAKEVYNKYMGDDIESSRSCTKDGASSKDTENSPKR
jgi:hypothetical protein